MPKNDMPNNAKSIELYKNLVDENAKLKIQVAGLKQDSAMTPENVAKISQAIQIFIQTVQPERLKISINDRDYGSNGFHLDYERSNKKTITQPSTEIDQ
jgi:hypothetical protein